MVAGALTMAARFEWRRTSQRPQEKFADLRRQGRARGGTPTSRDIADHIIEQRASGQTWQAIANELNERGAPTTRSGGTWWPSSSVRSAHLTRTRDLEEQRRPLAG